MKKRDQLPLFSIFFQPNHMLSNSDLAIKKKRDKLNASNGAADSIS